MYVQCFFCHTGVCINIGCCSLWATAAYSLDWRCSKIIVVNLLCAVCVEAMISLTYESSWLGFDELLSILLRNTCPIQMASFIYNIKVIICQAKHPPCQPARMLFPFKHGWQDFMICLKCEMLCTETNMVRFHTKN